MLNPQLSAGWAGRLADLSLFASFGGRGARAARREQGAYW